MGVDARGWADVVANTLIWFSEKGLHMSVNLSWFKYTGLAAVQSAAHSVLGIVGGDALNVWHLDYQVAAGIGLGAALVSVLGSIGAYKLPDGKATDAISVSTSAATNADTVASLAGVSVGGCAAGTST